MVVNNSHSHTDKFKHSKTYPYLSKNTFEASDKTHVNTTTLTVLCIEKIIFYSWLLPSKLVYVTCYLHLKTHRYILASTKNTTSTDISNHHKLICCLYKKHLYMNTFDYKHCNICCCIPRDMAFVKEIGWSVVLLAIVDCKKLIFLCRQIPNRWSATVCMYVYVYIHIEMKW